MSRFATIAVALLAGAVGAAIVIAIFVIGGMAIAPSPLPAPTATHTRVPTWTPTLTPTPTVTPTLTIKQQAEEWLQVCDGFWVWQTDNMNCFWQNYYFAENTYEACLGYWMPDWMSRAADCDVVIFIYEIAIKFKPTPTPRPLTEWERRAQEN